MTSRPPFIGQESPDTCAIACMRMILASQHGSSHCRSFQQGLLRRRTSPPTVADSWRTGGRLHSPQLMGSKASSNAQALLWKTEGIDPVLERTHPERCE